MRKKVHFKSQIRRKRKRNRRNKSCGNGSKNCVAFRNAMRNGIAIGNPKLLLLYCTATTVLQGTEQPVQQNKDDSRGFQVGKHQQQQKPEQSQQNINN